MVFHAVIVCAYLLFLAGLGLLQHRRAASRRERFRAMTRPMAAWNAGRLID